MLPRFWATFNQIKQMNAHVRRGETATHIILFTFTPWQ